MPIVPSSPTLPGGPATLSGTTDSRDLTPRKGAADKGSLGDTAFKDSLALVIGAWLVLLFLSYSLRRYNV